MLAILMLLLFTAIAGCGDNRTVKPDAPMVDAGPDAPPIDECEAQCRVTCSDVTCFDLCVADCRFKYGRDAGVR